MKAGKLTLTKGLVDAYPFVLQNVQGFWYTHSDDYGHYFIYHSYADAEKELIRVQNMLGEGATRGVYIEILKTGVHE